MATLLDAFALLALTLEEPAAGEVEAALRRGDCLMSAVNLAEAVDQLTRVHARDPAEVRNVLEPVLGELVVLRPVDAAVAWRAAELRRRHYRRRTSELSLADCVALASVTGADTLATADGPLARAARAEGLDVLALPDSTGRRP